MTGKQLLDAVYILKASRSVLVKHVELRSRQLDIYSKTSSLVKAFKSQTSRFPLTVRAISNLADRLKRSQGPDQSIQTTTQYTPRRDLQSGRLEKTEQKGSSTETRPGRESALLDTRLDTGSVTQLAPNEVSVTQGRDAQRSLLSDERAASANDTETSPGRGRDTFSDRSIRESQSNLLADTDQKSRGLLQPTSVKRSSIPTPTISKRSKEPDKARKLQRLAEKQIPLVSADGLTSAELRFSTSNRNIGKSDIDKQQDSFSTRPDHTSPAFSSLPRVKLPTITADAQDEIKNLSNVDINQDVFYSPKHAEDKAAKNTGPEVEALQENGQPTDAMYSEIFQSPRVARMLKENDKKQPRDAPDLGGGQDMLVSKRGIPHETSEDSSDSTPSTSSINPEKANSSEENPAVKSGETSRNIESGDPFSVSGVSFRAPFYTKQHTDGLTVI